MENKLINLHNRLFIELERLQDDDSYKNEDGTLNQDMIDAACVRADKVISVSDTIMNLQRLQLQAVQMAHNMGMVVKLPDVLGIEEDTTRGRWR